MSRTVLITGATGTVSTALLHALQGTDLTLRTLVRDASRADSLAGRVAEVVVGDLDDPRSLPPAFQGVQDLWLHAPNSPRPGEPHERGMGGQAGRSGTHRAPVRGRRGIRRAHP